PPAPPCLSGQSRVEAAVRDVARHFLGADQHARDFGVVDGGEVGPGADVHVEAGAREQLNRRILQRTLGNPHLDRAYSPFLNNPVRWPVCPTWPPPRRFTFTSTVSSSQSTRISVTASLLPDVSPLVHSVPRERLKKVA